MSFSDEPGPTADSISSLAAETRMDVLRKTAAIISENFGIDVVFKGDQACTDGRTIYVPSLPEDAPADLVEAIIGYIDHEVGHIRHTSFGERRPFTDKDKRCQMITNAIEDVRQEALMAAEYRGVGMNLERSSNWVLKRLAAKWDHPEGPGELFKIAVLSMARSKALQGWVGFSEFSDAHEGAFAPILEAVQHEVEQWHTLPNVTASYEACKRFLAIIDSLRPPPKGKPSEKEEGEGAKGPGKSPPPESKSDEDVHDKDEETSSSESSDEDKDEPSEEDEEADPAEEGTSDDADEPEDEGDDEPASEDGASPESDSSDPDEGEEGSGLSAETESILDGLCDEKDTPKEGGLSESLAGMIGSCSAGVKGHKAYTTEFDRSVPPSGTGTLEDYSKSLEDIRPLVNSVYTVLTRTLVAEGRSRVTFGLTEGKLATGSLAKLRVGDPGVFKKKRKGRDLNTYVEIVIDQSGSMGGDKIKLAQQTCVVLAEALERCGVPFGIVGFTCGWTSYGLDENPGIRSRHDTARRDTGGSKTDGFARTEPLIEYVYKRPEDALARCRPALSTMQGQYMSNNADGDSIMRIAKRVVKGRKENRKILIVLSDGAPSAACGDGVPYSAHGDYMTGVSKLIKKTKGLEVIGIGIMSGAVKKYYDHAVVVNDIEELPAVAMSELKNALLGSRH